MLLPSTTATKITNHKITSSANDRMSNVPPQPRLQLLTERQLVKRHHSGVVISHPADIPCPPGIVLCRQRQMRAVEDEFHASNIFFPADIRQIIPRQRRLFAEDILKSPHRIVSDIRNHLDLLQLRSLLTVSRSRCGCFTAGRREIHGLTSVISPAHSCLQPLQCARSCLATDASSM